MKNKFPCQQWFGRAHLFAIFTFLAILFLNLASGLLWNFVELPFFPVLSLGVATFYYYRVGFFAIFILFLGYVASFLSMWGIGFFSVNSKWFFVIFLPVIYTLQSAFFGMVFRKFSNGLPIGLAVRSAFCLISLIVVCGLFVPIIDLLFVSYLKIPAESVYFFVDDSSSSCINIFLDWVSVFFGVFFVFDLLSIISSDREVVRDKLFQLFSVLFVAVVSFSIIFFARRWEFKEEVVKYQIQSQRIVDAIQSRIDEQVAILNVLRNSFFTVSVNEETFRLLTYDFVGKFKTIQAVEWAPRVRGAAVGNFLALMKTGFPDFELKSKLDDDTSFFSRVGGRSEYFPVTYIQPYDANKLVQGFDLLSSVIRRDAVYRSLLSDGAVSTAPIRLIQDGDRGFGILLMQHAISKDGTDGIILLAIRVADFFNEYTPREIGNVSIKMQDKKTGVVVFDGIFKSEIWRGNLRFGDRDFEVRTGLSVPMEMLPYSWQSICAVLLTVFGSVMFFVFSYVIREHVFSTEKLVQIRTGDLEKNKNWIDKITKSIGEGVIVCDGLARVIFANPKAESMLGLDVGVLLGETISDFFSFSSSQAQFTGCDFLKEISNVGKGELLATAKDGHVFSIEYALSPMIGGDEGDSVVIIFSDVTGRKAYESMLTDYAFHDPLTGIYNRRYFMTKLDEALKKSALSTSPFILLFLDMDGFKDINDTFGHEAGDKALVEFSNRIKRVVRSADVTCRLGGDEFAILIENCTSPFEVARMISGEIQMSLKSFMDVGGDLIELRASIGVAIYHPEIDENHSADYIISRADAAMYDAKRSKFFKIAYA